MPKNRIPSITSVVATGRRMKTSEIFISGSRSLLRGSRGNGRGVGLDRDLRPGRETKLSVSHDPLARSEPLVDHGPLLPGAAYDDGPVLDRVVRLDDVYVRALLPGLDRRRGRDDGVRFGCERERDVRELSGPERAVVVCERGLQVDRAGGRVHRVVDEGERALGGRQARPVWE